MKEKKYCTFCKPSKVDAIYRDSSMNFACEQHKQLLTEDNDDYMTEADYQSWGKI